MNDTLQRLGLPFRPEAVEWRLGTMKSDKTKGMALAYIDARTVQDRFDEVCGPLWACEHVVSGGTRVTCRIGVKIGDEWVWRSDGAGETDVEGEKGSYSDSFKRAAVKWRVGRYLYDLASPWVEVTPMGKSFRIADHERAKLNALLAKDAKQTQRPAAVAPDAEANPAMVNVWRHEVSLCASPDDLECLKRTGEFKTAWSKMGPDDRAKVQGFFTTAAATLLSRKQAA